MNDSKKRKLRINMGVVHVIANCRDCSWQDTDYLVAQRNAAYHAKRKKHTISVEVAKAGTYNGKDDGA